MFSSASADYELGQKLYQNADYKGAILAFDQVAHTANFKCHITDHLLGFD